MRKNVDIVSEARNIYVFSIFFIFPLVPLGLCG